MKKIDLEWIVLNVVPVLAGLGFIGASWFAISGLIMVIGG